MSQSTIFDQLYIIGEIDRVIYMNQDNHFGVMRVIVTETNTDFQDETIVTGFFHEIVEGETYQFEGEVTSHPKYGEQFKSERYKKTVVKTLNSVISYLSGDNFPGIGKKTATNIANELGVNAIEKIADDINVLKDIKGLPKSKINMIHSHIVENYESENVLLTLNSLGFGSRLAVKIMATYGPKTQNMLDTDPYRMVKDIRGIGFKKADFIAQKNGLPADSIERLHAGITHTIDEYVMSEGHTYIDMIQLSGAVMHLLNSSQQWFTEDDIEEAVDAMMLDEQLVKKDNRVYIPSLYFSEKKAAEQLLDMKSNPLDTVFTEEDINETIAEIESDIGITYNQLQKEAIQNALTERVSIITGGPGTGKTTLVRGVIEAFSRLNHYEDIEEYDPDDYPIKLLAPTGRAAKRLSDLTGLRGTTIHRSIGWGRDIEEEEWADVFNEIEADVVIIDEMSMVDMWLFYQLMRNISYHTSIIFVGDKDQLPSVGPGNVYYDLIHSNALALTELTEVYRQGEGSGIVKLAHAINNEVPVDLSQKMNNVSFLPSSISNIPNYVHEITMRAVKKGYTMRDIQVLAPIYRGAAGINNLNKVLQEILNPKDDDKYELEFSDVIFREGDKVLQLVNRLEDNVFNGDAGIIKKIKLKDVHLTDGDVITVDFEGQLISYERKEMIELAHAYCTSIHKSQGSEYSIVIMPVVSAYHSMLYKNIIYTGITRAKESLVLCGDSQAFYNALSKHVPVRHTSLMDYLTLADEETSDGLPEHLTKENIHTIPALIGMDGISPYDFIDSVESDSYNENV